MFTSFSTALSALSADSTAIDVVGNNLANLNTTGFKTSEVSFQDLVTESLGAGLGDTQVGFGVATPLTVRQFTQGAIQTTSGVLDAAIQGDGFFVAQDRAGNTLYTRDGNFQTDKAGNLLTNTGNKVQGWTTLDPTTGEVNTNGPVGNIVVPVGSLKPPVVTTSITDDLNLNADATTDSTPFSTPITVYDSLGASHVLSLDFQKTGDNQWSYQVTVPGDEVSGGTAGTAFDISGASGTLTFDTNGQLTDPPNGTPITFSVSGLADGATDMSLTWNPYNSDGSGRITQFGGQPSNSSANAANGSPAAELDHVGLSTGGQVLAEYTDGTQVVVGQVALASIRNPSTLIAAGNNTFQTSALTANPAIGVPGTGGRGTVVGGSVEASTVDIATEFTNLIVYQRAYEANAHVVTTADTLSQDTINLIR